MSAVTAPRGDAKQTARLSEQVYESLVEMIVRGKLDSGQPISELELARTLSVSRTPVHEAVKQLVKDGLILQAANRRPVVVSFNSEDIRDVYEMRRILESEAASKAAQNMDRPALLRLEDGLIKFGRIRNPDGKLLTWVKLDDEFHEAIANASGSPRLAADIARYRLLNRVFNRSHTDVSVLDQAIAEHKAILKALFDRDSTTARNAMQDHLKQWQRFFANHLRS